MSEPWKSLPKDGFTPVTHENLEPTRLRLVSPSTKLDYCFGTLLMRAQR